MKFLKKVQSITTTNKESVFEVLAAADDLEEIVKELRFQANQAKRDPDESAQAMLDSVVANLYRVGSIVDKLNRELGLNTACTLGKTSTTQKKRNNMSFIKTRQTFTEADSRQGMIDKIVSNRLSTCSENYWADLLRGGFRGLNEWTLEELRTEVASLEDDA